MLVLLLSVCVCSVSAVTESQVYENGYLVTPDNSINAFSVSPLATSILTDWFNSGPYATDFRLPAGQNSVVVDVIANNGRYARRYVFPQSATSAGVYVNDQQQMLLMWSTTNENDVLYMYTSYDYDTGTFDVNSYSTIYPTEMTDGKYLGNVTYAAGSSILTVGGYVTNGIIADDANLGRSLAFPDGVILEEQKTQGMIATLGEQIKGWFENLVEEIKGLFVPSDEFFSEYSEKFEAWAREHFGFLFETIEIIDTTITKFIDFSPSDSATITFPSISFTVHNKEYVLWDSVTFNFNDLLSEVSVLDTIHTIYFTFVYALFFYLLYKLGEKSYNDIFGGSD